MKEKEKPNTKLTTNPLNFAAERRMEMKMLHTYTYTHATEL